MDLRLRELERAARTGDPAAVARFHRERCRTGVHDYRVDRLCAWCDRQQPGLPFWPALVAGLGHGAVGYAAGRLLAEAEGTFTGLPRLTRKQRGLSLCFRLDDYESRDERDRSRNPLPAWWKRPEEGFYRTIKWPLKKSQGDLAVMIKNLVWEPGGPWCPCRGRGYLSADEGQPFTLCEAHESRGLTEGQVAANAQQALDAEEDRKKREELQAWRALERLTDPDPPEHRLLPREGDEEAASRALLQPGRLPANGLRDLLDALEGGSPRRPRV